MTGSDRSAGRLFDQIEHAHAVGEDHGAAEPAAEREEAEADQGQDESRPADLPVNVVAVADKRSEQEEHRRRHHRAQVERGGTPQRRTPGDVEPVEQARKRGRHRYDQAGHERQPPRGREVAFAETEGRQDAERGRARVNPDRGVGQRRMKRMPGKAFDEVAELQLAPPARSSWPAGFRARGPRLPTRSPNPAAPATPAESAWSSGAAPEIHGVNLETRGPVETTCPANHPRTASTAEPDSSNVICANEEVSGARSGEQAAAPNRAPARRRPGARGGRGSPAPARAHSGFARAARTGPAPGSAARRGRPRGGGRRRPAGRSGSSARTRLRAA